MSATCFLNAIFGSAAAWLLVAIVTQAVLRGVW